MRLLLLVALVVGLARPACAEFGANVGVVARTYDKLETLPGLERVRSWRSVDTLGRFTWDDLGQREAWSVDLGLRYRLDWGTGKTVDDHDFDVLIARAAWRSPSSLVGLQLGRIQSLTGLGWKSFDGARVDFPRLPHLRVFAFAGLPVEHAENGAPDLGTFTWGAGVTGMLPHHGSVGVDYELRKFSDITAEEVAGFDASFRFGGTDISANADYDLVMDSFGETAVVLGQQIGRKHRVEARAVRVEPVTPVDSVFAVFDVNGYDEARLSYEFAAGDAPRGFKSLRLGGYASRENYVDTDLEDDEDISRMSVTASWRGKREARHRCEAGWLDGWSGARLALRHDSDWGLTPRLRLGVGASFQDFENFARLTDRDQVYAVRARLAHDHDGKWNVGFEIEQFIGRDRDTLRGMLTFGQRFGSARGERQWWGGRWNGATAPDVAPRSTESVQ